MKRAADPTIIAIHLPLNSTRHTMLMSQEVPWFADARGWNYQDAQEFSAQQHQVRDLVRQLIDRFSEDYASAVNLEEPFGTAHVYFKGAAPLAAVDLIREEADGVEVEIHENSGLNADEWTSLQDEVVEALLAHQYTDFGVGFDSVDTIVVQYPSDEGVPLLPTQATGETPAVLPAAAEGRVRTEAIPGPLHVDHSHGGVHGGGTMRSSIWSPACTAGWCVESGGVRGVVTAGHCSNSLTYENIYNFDTWTTTYQSQHQGTHGDFQWHVTTGSEWPNWWADELYALRRMDAVQTLVLVNDNTCLFGTGSDERLCSQVFVTSYSTPSYGNQVLVDDRHSVGGDSGGGWSWNTTAQGVNSGESFHTGAYRSRFSRADRVDNGIGAYLCFSP